MFLFQTSIPFLRWNKWCFWANHPSSLMIICLSQICQNLTIFLRARMSTLNPNHHRSSLFSSDCPFSKWGQNLLRVCETQGQYFKTLSKGTELIISQSDHQLLWYIFQEKKLTLSQRSFYHPVSFFPKKTLKRANISPSLQTVAPKNHFRRFPCFRNSDATSDEGTKRFGPQYAKRETRILRTALQLPILQMKRLCKFKYLSHKLDFCGWHDVTVIL